MGLINLNKQIMKKSIFMLGMALTACLISCTDDDLGDGAVKNPVQTGDEILFGSTLSGDANVIEKTAETKTVYGDRTSTGVPVYWEEDGSDEIAIFCLQASQPANHLVNYKVTPDATDKATASTVTKVNTAEAGLQWGDPSTEHRFYAFYPASAVKGTEEEDATGMITANIPVTQQVQEWRVVNGNEEGALQNKKTYFGLPNMDYAYMYAYNAVTPSQVEDGKFIDLQFHNLVTVLDITVQGPSSGTATITNINVDAIEGTQPILTGDFTCNIRNATTGEGITATCEPVGDFNEERGRISIPCYDKKTGQFIQLGPNELLNVKAYIIPQNKNNTVTQRTLRVTVSLLNGAPCRKTLQKADVTPHKINRVILPPLTIGGTNYWMSSLDPDIYVSELSIPGSKFSILTSENGAENIYQNATIAQQFQDGVRAFIFQTSAKGSNSDNNSWRPKNNTFTGDIKVVSESAEKEVMSLETAVKDIASYLKTCEEAGKTNEFAFLMLTFATGGDHDYGTGHEEGFLGYKWVWDRESRDAEQTWINLLRDKVNELAAVPENRIYTGEITPNTTIDDVKGKIILKANYNSEKMLMYYTDPKSFVYNGPDVKTTAPIMFTFWGTATGPDKAGDWTYQDNNGGMPMDWGVPVWYANSTAQLRWYYQEVTSVGANQEATKQEKEDGIKHLFQKSVDLYKNDNSHRTWFMNDLGGYYSDNGNINGRGTGIEALAIDMNQMGVDELQNREENAGLGLIFMNFADKQALSGVKYKSDWLIQTLIDNNFKFALRKKGDSTTPTYNASYNNGGNAVGWDE